MSAPQTQGYRLLDRKGVFLHRVEAISALAYRGLGLTQIDTEGPQRRVTDFTGSTHHALFVRGFHINVAVNFAIFREAVEEPTWRGDEVRYVVLVSNGDDWVVRGVVAGPLGETNPNNVLVGIDKALKGGDPDTTASAHVRIPTDYLSAMSTNTIQRVVMRRVLDEAAAVGTGFQQPDCRNIGAHLELHRDSLGSDDGALGTMTIGSTRVNAYYLSHEVRFDPDNRWRTVRVVISLLASDNGSPEMTRYITVLRWDTASNSWRLPHENGTLLERDDLIPVLQLGTRQAVPPLESIVADLRRG